MVPLLSSRYPAGKWLGFVTAIWVQAICGNNYTFSNYSDALKSLMSLTQLELNNLSVAKDVGKAFGLLSGLASDRWPTSVLLIIGSLQGFIGYGVQWLVVSERISPLPYWLGPVSGILKGYVGLSTAIFTDICAALFSSNPSKFLLMLAIVPAIVCITAVLFLHETPPASTPIERKQETQYFNVFNVIAIIIAVYLLAFDVTGTHGRQLSVVFAIGLLVLLVIPVLVVPLHSIVFKSDSIYNVEQPIFIEPLLLVPKDSPRKQQEKPEIVTAGTKQRPLIGEDHTIVEMIQTLDFWILFVSFLCGVGTGLCVMNNMGQMGLALGYLDVSIFISLTSIWGFFGRIVSGLASEHYLQKFGTPRPLWNAASQILMAFGYVVMALALPGSLYLGSILVGICYGVRLTITVPVASELFGLKYYGLLYNILILNLPLGSFLFSGLLAGYLYDAEATSNTGGGNTCVGSHCYMLVFFIMAFACVLGFGLDVLLARSVMESSRTTAKASSLRWQILRQALLRRPPPQIPEEGQSETSIKRISRKATRGFNLIPCHVLENDAVEETKRSREARLCYTLPLDEAPTLFLTQRVDERADLNDFEICNRYNVDNTGLVCHWPSEEVLAYFCLSHAEMFRSKRVIELGSGYGLAGLVTAAITEAVEVVISDGNPQIGRQGVEKRGDTHGRVLVQPKVGSLDVGARQRPLQGIVACLNLLEGGLVEDNHE
uniref:Calmodulin-lysine N-methyltransferase n=1 Tax=Fagus sylvatica TaxID=28930 RepID=A0A2N9ICT9_FAGSY